MIRPLRPLPILIAIALMWSILAPPCAAQSEPAPAELKRLRALNSSIEALIEAGEASKELLFARQSSASSRTEKKFWRALSRELDQATSESKSELTDRHRRAVSQVAKKLEELAPYSLAMVSQLSDDATRTAKIGQALGAQRTKALRRHLLFLMAKARLSPWQSKGYYDGLFKSAAAVQETWCSAFFEVLETSEPGLHHLALQGLIDNCQRPFRNGVVKRLQDLRRGSVDNDRQAAAIDTTLARLGDRRHFQARVKKLSDFIRTEAAKGAKANLLQILESEEQLADLFSGIRDQLNAAIARMDYLDILLPNFANRKVEEIPEAWRLKTHRQFYSLACAAAQLSRFELAEYALEQSFSFGGPYLSWCQEDHDLLALRTRKTFRDLVLQWKKGKKLGDAVARPKFFLGEKKALAALRPQKRKTSSLPKANPESKPKSN